MAQPGQVEEADGHQETDHESIQERLHIIFLPYQGIVCLLVEHDRLTKEKRAKEFHLEAFEFDFGEVGPILQKDKRVNEYHLEHEDGPLLLILHIWQHLLIKRRNCGVNVRDW